MQLETIDNGNAFDFGKTAADYAKYRNIYPQSMYEKLVLFGVGKPGQRILDLGSGTAVLPLNLYATGADFVATDISAAQIRCAERMVAEQGLERIRCKVCSAEDTGFDANSFDVVTAVQCFPYFDPKKATDEIYRVLRPQGRFCKIFMDWLPFEDALVAEMEALVLQYNPDWSGGGFKTFRYVCPDWLDGKFEIETIHSYNATLAFSKAAWLGRIKTCRGVGAQLPPAQVEAFLEDYRGLLENYSEPLQIRHQIHIEIYRSCKTE